MADALGKLHRQQRRLHALREADLLFQTDFVRANRFVKPRVLDRHSGLAREQRENVDVPLRERVEFRTLEIEHADAAVFQHQRNHQLRPRRVHHLDVARVGRYVGNVDRNFVQRRVADQPLPELDVRHVDLVAVPHRDLDLQLAGPVVNEEDAERAVVDDAAGQIRDPRQQLVEVENRAELAADLRQRLERAGVLALVLEQPRVLDGDGDVRAELAQQHLVDLGELAFGVAQQVQRADDAALPAQRHDKLGIGTGDGFDVSRIGVDVVHEQRQAFGHRRAHEPLSYFYSKGPDHIVRVADGVGDGQLLTAGIEQVDGECLKLGDARDELRDLLQQLVQIEHRRDFATQLEERDHELPDVRGSGGCRCYGLSHKSEVSSLKSL